MQKEPGNHAGHLRRLQDRLELAEQEPVTTGDGRGTVVSNAKGFPPHTEYRSNLGATLDVGGTKQCQVTREGVFPQQPALRVKVLEAVIV